MSEKVKGIDGFANELCSWLSSYPWISQRKCFLSYRYFDHLQTKKPPHIAEAFSIKKIKTLKKAI